MAASPDVVDEPTTASPLDQHPPPIVDHQTPRGARSGRATTAMVLGIVGVAVAVFLSPVGITLGIVAIVLGATARGDTRRTGMLGRGQATAGLVLGICSIVLAVAGVVLMAAIHGHS